MSQGQNSPGQSGTVYMILFILIMIGIMVLMNSRYDLVATVWKFVRTIEVCALSWIPSWVPVFGGLELGEACKFLKEADAKLLAPETVSEFDGVYAKYFSWLPAIILAYIGIKKIKKAEEVSEKFDAESMLLAYEKWFPSILSGVIKDNPLKHQLEYDRDIPETGKYGKSLSPENWAQISPPIGLEKEAKEDSSMNKPIWDGEDDFDTDLCERSLIKQLGDRYEGISSLNDVHHKMISIIHKKVPTSEKDRLVYLKEAMTEMIAEMDGEPKNKTNEILYPTFDEIKNHIIKKVKSDLKIKKDLPEGVLREHLKKALSDKRMFKSFDHKNDKKPTPFMLSCQMLKIERRLAKHAFINTGMMSLLVESRDAGRVDSFANFNWVKEKDRTLWYCLDTVGRNVSFVECAGVFAHWEIEKVVGKAISHPEVTTAVEALKKYLTVVD